MEVSKILKMDCSETDKLGLLFSGRMDAMNVFEEGRGAVTIKVWDELFQDLIAWKNEPEKTASNSDHKQCKFCHGIKMLCGGACECDHDGGECNENDNCGEYSPMPCRHCI